MNWEPFRADHSIERATASIVLVRQLDANTFDEVVVAGRKAAALMHLTDRIDVLDPFEISAEQPVKFDMPSMPPRRVVFRRMDADKVVADEFSIGNLRIMLSTIRYNRWKDFYDRLNVLLDSLGEYYKQNVKIAALDYLDRFSSTKPDADHFEVISRESEFLAPVVRTKAAALHVHCGWFDFETAQIRRLTAVNIDVSDVPIPPPPQSLT